MYEYSKLKVVRCTMKFPVSCTVNFRGTWNWFQLISWIPDMFCLWNWFYLGQGHTCNVEILSFLITLQLPKWSLHVQLNVTLSYLNFQRVKLGIQFLRTTLKQETGATELLLLLWIHSSIISTGDTACLLLTSHNTENFMTYENNFFCIGIINR